MRWTVHGERRLYESDWVNLSLVDVEVPGGERFEHHVVRVPRPASATVVHQEDRGVLLIWRHRFITDTWGWELPGGAIEPGETAAEAACREVLEETGWRPGPVTPLVRFHPSNGVSDQTFHAFYAAGATEVGAPTDWSESERVAWVPVDEAQAHLRAGDVRDGLSVVGLLWFFAFGPPDEPTDEP